MADYLAPLSPPDLAAWYGRLADRIARERVGGKEPLASQFLRQWLKNRDSKSTYKFVAPDYLQSFSGILDVLRFHRRVFLTEERGRLPGGRQDWLGILPRLQGRAAFARWTGNPPLDLHYESLVEIGSNLLDIGRIQKFGSAEERDLFAALRGFQLRSGINVSGTKVPGSEKIRIVFRVWACRVRDRYDFDPKEHLTLPNPDYQSKDKNAVRPQDPELTVHHSNAQRLEARYSQMLWIAEN